MNYILEYWEAIESGKVVTSRRVRAVYERLAREIRDPIRPLRTISTRTSASARSYSRSGFASSLKA